MGRILGFLAALLLATGASAVAIPVDWDSGGTTGTLDGIAVTTTGLVNPSVSLSATDYALDLTSGDFAGAPLAGDVELVDYSAVSDWTVSFSEPVSNLLLYLIYWRGASGQPPAGETVVYDFDSTFTLVSGLGFAVFPGGNTSLVAPEANFHSGILRFQGPLTALSITTNAGGFSFQAVTLALPEPSWLGLAALGLVLTRRRTPAPR
jgi:hypothetical protein